METRALITSFQLLFLPLTPPYSTVWNCWWWWCSLVLVLSGLMWSCVILQGFVSRCLVNQNVCVLVSVGFSVCLSGLLFVFFLFGFRLLLNFSLMLYGATGATWVWAKHCWPNQCLLDHPLSCSYVCWSPCLCVESVAYFSCCFWVCLPVQWSCMDLLVCNMQMLLAGRLLVWLAGWPLDFSQPTEPVAKLLPFWSVHAGTSKKVLILFRERHPRRK